MQTQTFSIHTCICYSRTAESQCNSCNIPIGHILRRNCLLKHVIEGKIAGRIEVKGRRGRRREQLLDDFKETRGCCTEKETLARSL